MFGNFRIRANFPTRRRAARPVRIKATDPATGEHVWLDPEESIVVLPMVHFLPPGMLRDPPVEPEDWTGATLEAKEIMPARPVPWEKATQNQLTFDQTFNVECLALTLAKIGHAYAAAEFGLDNFEPFLPAIIRGERGCIHTYVGGDVEQLQDPGLLHSIRLRLGHPSYGSRADFLLMVSIGLLSQFGSPTALVIVGRAKEDWAWREAERHSEASQAQRGSERSGRASGKDAAL
ncbi:hypothetical protein [Croceibacterium ferulae]|uniref:hypothetical protein n=1 Tax=Croceibacterium ferulae TaxID=1854641 RepID=UPI001F4D6B3D|nr:hypothetical protein [Croceibacterium ferulae]